MLNETQEVAFQNILVLGETNPLEIAVHGLTIDDAVTLGSQLLGGREWDRPSIRKTQIDDTFIVTANPEGTRIEVTIYCLPHLAETPFGAIQPSDEVEEEVERRDGV